MCKSCWDFYLRLFEKVSYRGLKIANKITDRFYPISQCVKLLYLCRKFELSSYILFYTNGPKRLNMF